MLFYERLVTLRKQVKLQLGIAQLIQQDVKRGAKCTKSVGLVSCSTRWYGTCRLGSDKNKLLFIVQNSLNRL